MTSRAPPRRSGGPTPWSGHVVARRQARPRARLPDRQRARPAGCAAPADGVYAGWLTVLDDSRAAASRCPPRSASAPTRPSTGSATAGWRPTCSTAPTSSSTTSWSRSPSSPGSAGWSSSTASRRSIETMAQDVVAHPRAARPGTGDDQRPATPRPRRCEATEQWFVRHGLPYFVPERARRRPRRAAAAAARSRSASAVGDRRGRRAVALSWLLGDFSPRRRRRCTLIGVVAAAFYGVTALRGAPDPDLGASAAPCGSLHLLLPDGDPRAAAAAAVRHVPVHQRRGLAGRVEPRRRRAVADRAAVRARWPSRSCSSGCPRSSTAPTTRSTPRSCVDACRGTPLEDEVERLIGRGRRGPARRTPRCTATSAPTWSWCCSSPRSCRCWCSPWRCSLLHGLRRRS